MGNYNTAVNELFAAKESLVIVGFTGRTGAGCSTAASILKKDFNKLDLEYIKEANDKDADQLKFNILKEYIGSEERWVPFTCIEGSCIILSYVFECHRESEKKSNALINYLNELQSDKNAITFKIDNFSELIKEIIGLDYIFKEIQDNPLTKYSIDWKSCGEEEIDRYYNLYINKLSDYKERIKKILLRYSCYEERKNKVQDEPPIKYHLYTYLLQTFGNNIRASGKPFDEEFSQNKILSFAKRIEQMINLVIQYDRQHDKSKSRICIDAIRNANESNYLKDRFTAYYLMSISVTESTRRRRLDNLNIDEQNSLDNVEYNSKLSSGEIFYHQNISNCFEMADIHLVNEDVSNGKMFFLTRQLVKYITLIIHPGLITPSSIERCMQLAYNAKYNSGCLSRQVGAVVTGADFAIKSVGWNEVPEGQLSCSLRDVDGYCKGNMRTCYSEFEYDDIHFQKAMGTVNNAIKKTDLHGRKFPFCFKDVYNGYKNEKNQVYTRALHAEENAFLQISKYGGAAVKGGYLFCTASPCELCSKKAYQLGITNIFYIDPYPGISERHILSFGKNESNPNMNLFYGAIGDAYIRLFKPLMAYKDEIELVSGVSCKKEVNPVHTAKMSPKDLKYNSIEFSIEFCDRENIESTRTVDLELINGTYTQFERKLTWTGSSYDNSELLDNNEGYTLIDSTDKVSPYKYYINFNKEMKSKDNIKYKIRSNVKDESQMMHPYFAQMIKYPTEHLTLNVIIPEESPLLDNVRFVRYADLKMEYEYEDTDNHVTKRIENEKIIYTLNVNKPNLFYTYSIEWDFMKVKS